MNMIKVITSNISLQLGESHRMWRISYVHLDRTENLDEKVHALRLNCFVAVALPYKLLRGGCKRGFFLISSKVFLSR